MFMLGSRTVVSRYSSSNVDVVVIMVSRKSFHL